MFYESICIAKYIYIYIITKKERLIFIYEFMILIGSLFEFQNIFEIC